MNRQQRRAMGQRGPQPKVNGSSGRVVYGAGCSWWDSISEASSKPSGLPCCPHCGGVLFEMPSEAEWWAAVARREASEPDPGYRAFIEWLRGKFLGTLADARQIYDRLATEVDGA